MNTLKYNKEKIQRSERFVKQRKYGELGKSIAEDLKNICGHNYNGNSDKNEFSIRHKNFGP
jgi:viroplasmin and RNaseH domain-containing protein